MKAYPAGRLATLGFIFKLAATLVAVIVTQGILAFRFKVFGFFDLALVCCVYYGFTLGSPIASILIGGALGLMQDSLSGAVLGANGMAKTLAGFLAAAAVSKFAVDQPLTRILGLVLFSIGDDFLVTMLDLIVGPVSAPTYSTVRVWLISAAFNTLLGLVLFGYHDRFGDAGT